MSRLRKETVLSFGERSKLKVVKGMTGATGNYYAGLHEFREMAFLLHLCRSGDLFIDVGANIGAYSVLIPNETGCDALAFEPVPGTFDRLRTNLDLNELSRVTALNHGVGAKAHTLRFTEDRDTVNRVMFDGESGGVEVSVIRLDDVVRAEAPLFMKVDVEGFEWEVLSGAESVLEKTWALVIELNGSGEQFGHTDDQIRGQLTKAGFEEWDYDPFNRSLTAAQAGEDNAIFVKSSKLELVKGRLREARAFKVRGVTF